MDLDRIPSPNSSSPLPAPILEDRVLHINPVTEHSTDSMELDSHPCDSRPPGSPRSFPEDSDLTLLCTLLELAATKRAAAAEHCEKFTMLLEESVSEAPSPHSCGPPPSSPLQSRPSLDTQSQLYYNTVNQHPSYRDRRVPSRRSHRSTPRRSLESSSSIRHSRDFTSPVPSSSSLQSSHSFAHSPFLLPSPASCQESSSFSRSGDGFFLSTPPSPSPHGPLPSPPMHRANVHVSTISSPFSSNQIASTQTWSCAGGWGQAHGASSAPHPHSSLDNKARNGHSSDFYIPHSTSLPLSHRRPNVGLDSLSGETSTQRSRGVSRSSALTRQSNPFLLSSESLGSISEASSRRSHQSSRRRHGLDLPRGREGLVFQVAPQVPSTGRTVGISESAPLQGANTSPFCSLGNMTLKPLHMDHWSAASGQGMCHKGQRSRRMGLDLCRDELMKDLSPEKFLNSAQ